MKKKVITLAAALALATIGYGQISLTAINVPHTEDFDTTTATVPAGWAFVETGTAANTLFATGTGSGTTGDTYFYGTAGEWAFGGLQSGSLVPTIGASFTNNTGVAVDTLHMSFTGETWRIGTAGRADSLLFSYSLDATSLNTGSWISVSSLNYTNVAAGATAGGSLQHSAEILGSITGLTIANGSTFWIRWTDFNASGSDDGMAVDDFSITAIPEPSTYAVIMGVLTFGFIVWRRRQKA